MLIPKKGGVENLRDFRPISLVRWGLAKVLANRFKKVVRKVVSYFQHAFIQSRQILDAVLIAREAIDSGLKSNLFGIFLKMDVEKAYDHVNRDFLLAVMGFRQKWIK